jgi:RND family efflux transporter MFP subunit
MKKNKKKIILIVCIVLVAVILLGSIALKACSSLAMQSSESTGDDAQVQSLQLQDLSTAISTTGTVESQSVISVASDLTYQIKELPVALGDYVEAGQVLCVFDDTALKEEIAALEKTISESNRLSSKQLEINQRSLESAKTAQQEALAEAQAKIDSAKKALDQALANYQAQGEDAYADYAEAQSVYNEAVSSYKQTERSTNETIQACQDTIDTEQSSASSENEKQLAELKRKLEKTTVTAESSGIITSLSVHQGSVHSGGELMTIQDNTKMKLVVSLTENDVVKVKEGMKAEITANALEDEVLSGTVSKIINFATSSTSPDSESGSGYSAEILIDDPGDLLLGMSAKARIILEDVGEVLAVPYDSIAYEDDGSAYVLRANANEDDTFTLEKISVEIGVEADYYTQVSSDALSQGDYILSTPEAYSDGEVISVNPIFLEE